MSYTHCTIKVIFNNLEYTSMKLDLKEPEISNIVYHILENGTSQLDSYQLPVLNDEVIIFSREQLDMALFNIKFFTERIKIPRRKKKDIDTE